MENLSDEVLMTSYMEAKQHKLDPSFIHLLEQELHRRSIPLRKCESGKK